MAGIEVTITGMLYDKLNRTTQNVVLIGEATLTGLGVGGGPMPPGPGIPGQPPGIWGPPGPWPTPPIYFPPGTGGGKPPTIWPSPGHPAHPIVIPPTIWPNPPEGTAPHPEHPIVIPPPPDLPNAPPLEVKVVWTSQTGWAVVLVPTGTHPVPSA